jgi:DNA-binding CsgD family transcriptional regulator
MRSIDLGLLASLNEGMFEQPLWQSFLERLRNAAGVTHVTLAFHPPEEREILELHVGPPAPAELRRVYSEKFTRGPLPYQQMREGRVYAMDELLSPQDAEHASYREFLLSVGVKDLRSVRITEVSGVDAWLICGGHTVRSSTAALISALVPHLRIALRVFVALEREKLRSSLTSEAFGRLNFGWLTLDAQCRIIDMTPHAEEMFRRTAVLRKGRYDRLTPTLPAVDRELTALIKQFVKDPESRPRAINLSRDPWMTMLVAPIRGRLLSTRGAPVAVVYLSGDRTSSADRCEQLVELFGLLPSEARLAWAIAQGVPIAEAAANLGITVETARNYSKKIYAKTGARGQAELVRIVLSSVMAFA